MDFISPKVDIVFKKLFGVEENKDLLIDLINSIVEEKDQVSDVTLLNPYNAQNFINDKLSILDIKAKGLDGKLFNIEIQIMDEADYHKRALFYWAKMYTGQLSKGDNYSKLCKAIGIHILNFTSITEDDDYHHRFVIKEDETGIRYFHDLEIHTIELNKFAKSDIGDDIAKLASNVRTSLDKWTAFLTNHNLLHTNDLPAQLNDDNIKKAVHVLDVMNFSATERDLYEDHLKWLMLEANTLDKAEAKGRAKGVAEGLIKGREEIAFNLLAKGFSVEDTANMTNLPVEIVRKLRE